jgi:tetratricopeptide (TPR) repeat protein
MDILLKVKASYNNLFDKINKGKGFSFFYNRGIDNYNKKSYSLAVKDFEIALKKDDVQPQVYYNLGLVYQKIENFDKAIEYYTKFITLVPEDYDAFYNLAFAYFAKDSFDKTIELLNKIFQLKKEPESVGVMAKAYIASNKYDAAISFADDFFDKENPDNLQLYFAVARVFEAQSQFGQEAMFIDKAIEMYTKLFDTDFGDKAALYLSLSLCYAKKKIWDDAIDFCKKALNINKKMFEANNQMGLIYFMTQNYEAAIKFYNSALKIKPKGDTKVYTNLAYAYETNGQFDKAVKIFDKLLCEFPDFPVSDEIENHVRILRTLAD